MTKYKSDLLRSSGTNLYQTEQIARFTHSVSANVISPDILEQLKRHLLDTIGSLIQAQQAPDYFKTGQSNPRFGNQG